MIWPYAIKFFFLFENVLNFFFFWAGPDPAVWAGPELVRPKVHWNSRREL